MIHSEATPQALNFFRKYVFCICLFIVAYEALPLFTYFPRDAFVPTGFLVKILPANWQLMLLDMKVLYGMQILICLGCILTIMGRFLHASGLLVSILFIYYQSIHRGYGHVSHVENILLYAIIFLTVCLFADKTIKHDSKGFTPDGFNLNSVPLVGILAVICLCYSFIGVQRIVNSGFEIYGTETLVHSILRTTKEARMMSYDFTPLMYEYPWIQSVLKAGFPIVNMMELLAPLNLISRRFRILFLVVMGGFHIACLFLMKIFFWENILLYILLFDFSRWFKKTNDPVASPR